MFFSSRPWPQGETAASFLTLVAGQHTQHPLRAGKGAGRCRLRRLPPVHWLRSCARRSGGLLSQQCRAAARCGEHSSSGPGAGSMLAGAASGSTEAEGCSKGCCCCSVASATFRADVQAFYQLHAASSARQSFTPRVQCLLLPPSGCGGGEEFVSDRRQSRIRKSCRK